MEDLMFRSLLLTIRLALWAVLLPFGVASRLYRWTKQLAGAVVLTRRDALPCFGCGSPVSLVGRFECGRCRYVFDGFAFTRCAVCGAAPPFIPCQVCGVGLKNPVQSV